MITPDSSGEIGLIINIEAQNKYNNGYPLIVTTEAADALEIPEADRPKYKRLVEDADSTK